MQAKKDYFIKIKLAMCAAQRTQLVEVNCSLWT